MSYDRKPAYGPKKTPPKQAAPEPAKEPSAEELERERQHEALVARGRAYGEANPRLTDLENYPREAFAGPGRRLLAFMIDCVAVMPTMLIIAWMLGALPGQETGIFGLDPRYTKLASKIAQFLLYDFYFVGMLHVWGRTWGVMLARYSIVRRDLGKPTKGMARGRYWATVLSIMPLGLGLLWVLGHKHKRGWHDLMAGTYAVKRSHLIGDLAAAAETPQGETAEQFKERHNAERGIIVLNLLLFAPGMILVGIGGYIANKLGLMKPGSEEIPASLQALEE
ncbi:MAG: hypothetical protein HPKKFMNG_01032 [Planctomycetes bacterium]|nr:hypothetical protein [Planctomycetota bacterium]